MTKQAQAKPHNSLFNKLAFELDKETYERVERQSPAIAGILHELIADGANADHIRIFVRGYCFDYEQRERLIAAARYLEKVAPCC